MTDTKEYIIDQAYRLFLHKSYEAVSISDISNAIGFTKGALYHHFRNKEELFKAVIDKYLSVIGLTEIREGSTLEEFIEYNIYHVKQIIRTVSIDDLPFIPVDYLSLLIDALRHYPGFEENNENYFSREIDKVKNILDEAVRKGEIREDINTQLASLNFFAISIGVAGNMFRQNSAEEAIELFQAQMWEQYKLLKK